MCVPGKACKKSCKSKVDKKKGRKQTNMWSNTGELMLGSRAICRSYKEDYYAASTNKDKQEVTKQAAQDIVKRFGQMEKEGKKRLLWIVSTIRNIKKDEGDVAKLIDRLRERGESERADDMQTDLINYGTQRGALARALKTCNAAQDHESECDSVRESMLAERAAYNTLCKHRREWDLLRATELVEERAQAAHLFGMPFHEVETLDHKQASKSNVDNDGPTEHVLLNSSDVRIWDQIDLTDDGLCDHLMQSLDKSTDTQSVANSSTHFESSSHDVGILDSKPPPKPSVNDDVQKSAESEFVKAFEINDPMDDGWYDELMSSSQESTENENNMEGDMVEAILGIPIETLHQRLDIPIPALRQFLNTLSK